MTQQYKRNIFEWVLDNRQKIKSVILSTAAYVTVLEAASPNESFWEIFTAGGVGGALVIVGGIVNALISGWRTTEEPGKLAQAKINRQQPATDGAGGILDPTQ